MPDQRVKIGDVFLNKQFPDCKVEVMDIGVYTNQPLQICFLRQGANKSEPSATLDIDMFIKFYEKES